MSKRRYYYSEREGSQQNRSIGLEEFKNLFIIIYNKFKNEGYFQFAFGYECIDAGYVQGKIGISMKDDMLLKFPSKNLYPIEEKFTEYNEEDCYDIIEYLFDRVSKPIDSFYHSYNDCGLHVKKGDRIQGKKDFREQINTILERYEDGNYELNIKGEIITKISNQKEPEIIPEQKQKCVACKGEITSIIFKCANCSVLYDFQCAFKMQKEGGKCLVCDAEFPEISRIHEEDPIIISIEEISHELDNLLQPDEIIHKNLTPKFIEVKENLQKQLIQKISYEFYDLFSQRIEDMFEKMISLNADKLDMLENIRKELHLMFQVMQQEHYEIKELIIEYESQIEEVFDKFEGQVDDLENFLIEKLGNDWDQIKDIWRDYKEGRIKNKKQLIWRIFKFGGKKLLVRFFKKIV